MIEPAADRTIKRKVQREIARLEEIIETAIDGYEQIGAPVYDLVVYRDALRQCRSRSSAAETVDEVLDASYEVIELEGDIRQSLFALIH